MNPNGPMHQPFTITLQEACEGGFWVRTPEKQQWAYVPYGEYQAGQTLTASPEWAYLTDDMALALMPALQEADMLVQPCETFATDELGGSTLSPAEERLFEILERHMEAQLFALERLAGAALTENASGEVE